MTNSNSETYALFDFDGTITYFDTFGLFLILSRPIRFILVLPNLLLIMYYYFQKKLNDTQAKEAILISMFGGMSRDRFDKRCEWFAKRVIPLLVKRKSLKRIAWHKKKGHRLIIVSASPVHYISPWAKRYGFEQVLATKLKMEKNHVGIRLVGINCNNEEKVRRVKHYAPKVISGTVYAYGNSKSDRALLKLADHAYYRKFA